VRTLAHINICAITIQKRTSKDSAHNAQRANNCMGALRKEPYRAHNPTNVSAI